MFHRMNEMNKDHSSSKLKMNNKIEIQEARESGSLHLCDETNKSQKKKYCRKIDFVWIIWEVSNSPKIIPVTHNKLLEYNEGFRRTWRTSYYNSSEIRGIIKQPGIELSLHKGSGFLHISEWEGIHEMRWTLQPLLIFILLGKDDLCGISNL